MTDKEKQEIADLVIKKMLQARSNMEKDLFNINDILFTDYFEIDEKEELVKQGDSYFDTWKLHSDYLSQQNVYKINEKQTLELR